MTADLNWNVMTHSVCGAVHERRGLPNQDHVDSEIVPFKNGNAWIIAVSDGHGSAKYFRSHIGAKLATTAALEVLKQILAYHATKESSPSQIKRTVEVDLPKGIIYKWEEEVTKHLRENPIHEDEWTRLEEAEGNAARRRLQNSVTIPYGATLLAVAVTREFIIYLQLGDGDIVEVYPEDIVQYPISEGQRLVADETYSLCSPKPKDHFHVRFQTLIDVHPTLIFVATDGYSKSYPGKHEFQRVVTDYSEVLFSEGKEVVVTHLPMWLSEVSSSGSGDDVTVAILFREAYREDALESGLESKEFTANDIEQSQSLESETSSPQSVDSNSLDLHAAERELENNESSDCSS